MQTCASFIVMLAAAAPVAAAPLHFEAGPGCASPDAFKALVPMEGDWAVSLVPAEAGWALELSRGDARALVRKLPPAASCEALAEASSLIIERYFREVAAGRALAPPPHAVTAVPQRDVTPPVREPAGARESVPPVRVQPVTPRPPDVVPAQSGTPPIPVARASTSVAPTTTAAPTTASPATASPATASPATASPATASPATRSDLPSTSAPTTEILLDGAPPLRENGVALGIELSAGGGLLAQPFADIGAWATADLTLRLDRNFRVGLLGGFGSFATRSVQVNTVGTRTAYAAPFSVDVQGGLCGTLGIELCGALVAGVRGIHGGGSPDLFHAQPSVWTVSPNAGLLARAQVRPWRGLFIALEATATANLFRSPLYVEGSDANNTPTTTVFGVQAFDITASLQLGWAWSLTPSEF